MTHHARLVFGLIAVVFGLAGCAAITHRDNTVKVTIVHINDVYEISPVDGGRVGGLARVATLYKTLRAENPNTILTLGGDFLSPSVIGVAKVDGQRVAGKQMVDVLNAMGVDYATFGNHEFDLTQAQFDARVHDITFPLVSSNVTDVNGKAFGNAKSHEIRTFVNDAGTPFRVGLFGVTLDANKKDFVRYTPALTVAGEQATQLAANADFVVGLTHLAMADDEQLVKQHATVGLVLGGHEHENYQHWRGDFAPILKADSNVRSVYVVDLIFNPSTKKTHIAPRLVPIDDRIEQDPDIKKIADKWMAIANEAFRQEGLDPDNVVATIAVPLDGLESSVRVRSTNLTRMTAKAMLRPYADADMSLFNAGSIRVDDVLNAGQVTLYDVLRILPFGGAVPLVEMKGDLLLKVLEQGERNSGTGGFLHGANIERGARTWMVKGAAIEPSSSYKVAIADFLLSGKETGLDFLTKDNPGIKIVNRGDGSDIRKLLAAELEDSKGNDR